MANSFKIFPSIFVFFLLISFPGPASAQIGMDKEFEFGAGIGYLLFQDNAAYVGNAPSTIRGMGGSTSGSYYGSGTIIPILTQTWSLIPHLSLELKERFWMQVVKGTFANNPEFDYRLEKDIWPINLLLKLTFFKGSSIVGGSLYAGPGIYIIDMKQRGYYGQSQTVEGRVGIHAGVELNVIVIPEVEIRIDFSYDGFSMDPENPIVGDGGEGGGFTFSVGAEYLF